MADTASNIHNSSPSVTKTDHNGSPPANAKEKLPGDVSPSSTSADDEEVISISEKKLIRKLDYRLLPPVTLLYLLSFLDRSNGASSSSSNQILFVIWGQRESFVPRHGR